MTALFESSANTRRAMNEDAPGRKKRKTRAILKIDLRIRVPASLALTPLTVFRGLAAVGALDPVRGRGECRYTMGLFSASTPDRIEINRGGGDEEHSRAPVAAIISRNFSWGFESWLTYWRKRLPERISDASRHRIIMQFIIQSFVARKALWSRQEKRLDV